MRQFYLICYDESIIDLAYLAYAVLKTKQPVFITCHKKAICVIYKKKNVETFVSRQEVVCY